MLQKITDMGLASRSQYKVIAPAYI